MSYVLVNYLNEKWINNKVLKINDKDIIYAEVKDDDLGWKINLYTKFRIDYYYVECCLGSVQLPTNFNLNLKWYEIDEVKDLIIDYLGVEPNYEVINKWN